MGSGYGGKHTVETAGEAARLAKAAGKPVKVVWTREEEFTWAYFRPGGLIEVTLCGSFLSWTLHREGPAAARLRQDLDAALRPYLTGRVLPG